MYAVKTFAKGSFYCIHVGDPPSNKMNLKIETDRKILYNGINLAWSRAMLFLYSYDGFT